MHVFLATDGSASALAAEQMLATFPFGPKPRLTVATVCPAADLHAIQADVTSPITEMLDRCRDEAAKLLVETADRCRLWAAAVDRLLLDGHPADELLKVIERLHPDVVVVGSRGLGAVRRMLLGSVSERIAKHSPCSVLVVHPREGQSSIRNIVMAYDDSPASRSALERFSELPLGREAQIRLLNVVETVHVYGTELVLEGTGGTEVERAAAARVLAAAAKRFTGRVGRVEQCVETSADVAGTILDAAAKSTADLIVIGSRGKSLWERFLLGSVTLRVLHHAPCSVWVERQRA
jgi:nucleotide-binding universal stress UspA family protein